MKALGLTGGVERPSGAKDAARGMMPSMGGQQAPYSTTLALTVTFAVASFLVAMSLVLLVIHPAASGALATFVIGQNQSAKTALYLGAFGVILPLALLAGPRVADQIAAGPNGAGLPVLAGALAATLAATIVLIKLSGQLPWGDGLGVVLVAVGVWWALAAATLARALQQRPWPRLVRLGGSGLAGAAVAGALIVGTLLCVTDLKALSPLALGLGAAVLAVAMIVQDRLRLPALGRWRGTGFDLAIAVILLLAIPDVVVFHPSPVPPSSYVEPGIIQFHQDFLLGPTNQLLRGGGALLVNVPVSQYGVGFIYFLAGWFHLAPIGYGAYGLLDGIVTGLFYIAGYAVLRIVGVGRLLAASALALAVVTLIYHLYYAVGALPQQGPLRFGLPMIVIVAAAIGARWPRRSTLARAVALGALGVAAIWALEAFVYTLVTLAAVAALDSWLLPAGTRLRWLARLAALAAGACVAAHLILAILTLVATGQLPDWGQYLAYVRALVLGGEKAGQISYGYARWSPGLAVGAAYLASAAAIVLLLRRAPATVSQQRTTIVALTGSTAYSIALFSYGNNRSSTYLLPYVALPALLTAVLWLRLLLDSTAGRSGGIRRGGLAFALSVAAIMLAAAWPTIHDHFSNAALAHAYPGGGLRAALHRLWHPPPIDPRAPAGERLLDRYMPGKRALIDLPDWPDLATEILIRSDRSNALFIGDPKADAFVRSNTWTGRLARQIAALRPGARILTDDTALRVIAQLRGRPSSDPIGHPVGSFNPQLEWILQRLDERFRVQPIYHDRGGFVVAELAPR